MIRLTQYEIELFDDNFDSADLLECIDSIDSMRCLLRYRDIAAPLRVRDDFIRMHTILFDGIKQNEGEIDEEFPDLLLDVIDTMESLITRAENILQTLKNAQNALPARVFE